MIIGRSNMPVFAGTTLDVRQQAAVALYVQTLQAPPSPGGWGLGFLGPVTEGLAAFFGLCALLVAAVWLAWGKGGAGPGLDGTSDDDARRTATPGDHEAADGAAAPVATRRGGGWPAALGLLVAIAGSCGFVAFFIAGNDTQRLGGTLALAFLGLGFALAYWGRDLTPDEVAVGSYPLPPVSAVAAAGRRHGCGRSTGERRVGRDRRLAGERRIRRPDQRLGLGRGAGDARRRARPQRRRAHPPQVPDDAAGRRRRRGRAQPARAAGLARPQVARPALDRLAAGRPSRDLRRAPRSPATRSPAAACSWPSPKATPTPPTRRSPCCACPTSRPSPGRESWSPEGFFAYSRVCTHAGCAVSQYEDETRRSLCPCHQSTFDLLRRRRPVAGPAARPLPQLPLAIDAGRLPRRAERLHRAHRPRLLEPLCRDDQAAQTR